MTSRESGRATSRHGGPAWMTIGLVALAAAAFSGLGVPREAAAGEIEYWRGINPVTALTAGTFSEPPANDRPWVRWNFPPASATIPQLEKELDELSTAGIAGVEIGQGGNPTNEQLTAILRKATPLGITVGIKYSGGAPTEGTWSQTNEFTRTTLEQVSTVVRAGGSISAGFPSGARPSAETVAVLAYRCAAPPCQSGVAELDRSSVVDLTPLVTDGDTGPVLDWVAPSEPADAEWVVIQFHKSVFQNAPEVLTREGTDAMIAGYEALWTPELKDLLRANRSDVFVDSHATDPWGTPTELWSTHMPRDFEQRAGYPLMPNLAALFYESYRFSDGSDERVRTDFYQVRNDLFIDNRVVPFTKWANSRGMTLRLQPEDPGIIGPDPPMQDQIDMAYHLQRPEHESLAGVDQIDNWRPIASANHMNGNPWFSTECCAAFSGGYAETLQDVIVRMSKSFAGGITKNVYHVYPHAFSPESTWPGFSTFGVLFSESWGPRNPNWAAGARPVNDWMARTAQVLTQGRADVDVAVYLHGFEWPTLSDTNVDGSPFGKHWDDPGLQRAGYTWDYLNPDLVGAPNAKVKAGRLAPDGPSYRALIIDDSVNTPAHPLKTAMSVDSAQRILRFAQDGLPIIIVGKPPDQTPGDNGDDERLRAVVADLLDEPTVHRVAGEDEVPAALAQLGIRPDADPHAPSSLVSVHRADSRADTDYYFLYNQGFELEYGEQGPAQGPLPAEVALSRTLYEEPQACRDTGALGNPCRGTGNRLVRQVTLKGDGQPYTLDAWSGKITPIAHYTRRRGTVTVPIALERDESTIIVLTERRNRFGINAPGIHVERTTADAAAALGDRLVVQDAHAGTYATTLSNGRTVQARIGAVPEPIDLSGASWRLEAEDWRPANPYGTQGEAGAATDKRPVDITLTGLRPWPDIPELADASGVGTYTTTVDLPGNWSAEVLGAILDLGQVQDTVDLRVNGRAVPTDQVTATADVGLYLKAGTNTIAVRVATTLNNRLAALDPSFRARGLVEEYGLAGPVMLTPYGRASLPSAGGVASEALACSRRRLVLVDVVPGRRRVRLAGYADLRHVGRRVSIVGPRGRRVARPRVRRDGSFRATAPLPARSSNRARYQARLGRVRSPRLKLMRRMRATSVRVGNRRVTIAGRISGPLTRPPARVELRRRISCGRWQRVKWIRPTRRGRFRATLAAPPQQSAATYRLGTRVRVSRGGRRVVRTFTVPVYVDLD